MQDLTSILSSDVSAMIAPTVGFFVLCLVAGALWVRSILDS